MLKYSAAANVAASELASYTRFALDVAAEAGQATLSYFRAELAVENKGGRGRYDPVTQADREVERVIRERVEAAYPQHGIFGEEFGLSAGNGLTWVIDPIDGTRAFMMGMLHWGVLLALFDGERPLLGVMHQPFTGETFYGNDEGAWYRHGGAERRLRVRRCESLEKAVLTTTSPRLFRTAEERAAFDRLEAAVKLSKYGGDCYIYAMLAMGCVDLATDADLNPYDIQALMPIIQGAGGVVSTVEGGDASMGGFVLAAGDSKLHAMALERMMGA